jgi:hypothetical protein
MQDRAGEGSPDSGLCAYDPGEALREIRKILLRRGLLDPDEGLTETMLEDLVHFAYFTGCIPKGAVQRLLGLSDNETKERIRSWKKWQDGNRSCQLRQNPFYEEWPAEGEEPAELGDPSSKP